MLKKPFKYDSILDQLEEVSDKESYNLSRSATAQVLQDILEDVLYAGTYEVLEIPEIKRHLQMFLRDRFSIPDMVRFLKNFGYHETSIRKAIKEFFGIDYRELELKNIERFLYPEVKEIPAVNLGWGKSRDEIFDYYFIMPYVRGEYAVFGQKGDISREVVFVGSREECENKLVELTTESDIPQEYIRFASIQEEISEETPSQYFESFKDKDLKNLASVVEKVEKFIDAKNKRLKNFEIEIKSFKYVKFVDSDEIVRRYPEFDLGEFVDSNALIAIIIDIVDKRKDPRVSKLGLLVFFIVDNDVRTTDTFKGEDNVLYALTDEGLQHYFEKHD
jgi:hypothetical protein